MCDLIKLLSVQSESLNQFRMFTYIIRELHKIECKYFTYNGCIYVTKGNSNSYPCIVSHMDTVHEIVENLTPIEVNGNITGINAVTMEQTGIGGDDKVGIYIALQSLKKFDNIKLVFFRDEEIGCLGSYNPCFDFFKDCRFILQCDRKGNKDFIVNANNTSLSSNKFQNDVLPIIKKYGYSFNTGMMTDVMALKESGIDCSMANISCGYYNPHSPDEYINLKDLKRCQDMVFDLIENLSSTYTHKYKKKVYKYDRGDWFNSSSYSSFQNECECCGNIGKLTFTSYYNNYMCKECIKNYII